MSLIRSSLREAGAAICPGFHSYVNCETQAYPSIHYSKLNITTLYKLILQPIYRFLSQTLPLSPTSNLALDLLPLTQKTSTQMADKSKILIIGATGYIGKFIVEASVKAGHPTFALVRETAAKSPDKSKIIESFKSSGVTVIYGDIHDQDILLASIKQVDVVISAVAGRHVPDQLKIIAAIKEAGNIKRFLPSEFGGDGDRNEAVEPVASIFKAKGQIRRTIEEERIPYTYVVTNGFAGSFLPNLAQINGTSPPRDKVVILGDGNTKAIFVEEEDVATYTIKAVDDPRTLNKTLYMRPPANVASFHDLVSLWERKIGKTLEKTYLPEDQLLKNIQEATMPLNLVLAVSYSFFVKGDSTNYEIDPSIGVEASELYPDVKYTTVDEYLNQFV